MKRMMILGASIFCMLACVFSIIMFILTTVNCPSSTASVVVSATHQVSQTDVVLPEASSADGEATYVSPVDFAKLQKDNPDVCAWLDIPDAQISYPVMHRVGDNTFYLDHDSNTAKSDNGALFIEDYNSVSFDDPVMIIYGHHMLSKKMFGALQRLYSDAEWFAEHPSIYVYLPDRMVDYEVFAAIPYSNRHILYYYDFSVERQFNDFFDDVFATRSLSANFRSGAAPKYGEKVLILSTCLRGNRLQRYLVLAVEVNGTVTE